MKKLILLPIMLLLLIMSVFAYDVNDTLRINGEYREGGVLTVSSGQITIYLPNGLVDVNAVTMNDSGVGLTFYDYVIPNYEGEYIAEIDYFKGVVNVGTESQSFDVGDVNNLKWGTCPNTSAGRTMLYIVLGILILIGIVGIMTKITPLVIFSGVIMLLSYLITVQCGNVLWVISVFLGLIFLLIGASIKS